MKTYQTFGVVALLLLLVSCSKPSRTEYYYPADLKGMNLPAWQVTNAIPLTPDQAVSSAINYLKPKHPNVASWDVDRIELSPSGGNWIYDITLTDRGSGHLDFENIRVLLDGNVWKPSSERTQ